MLDVLWLVIIKQICFQNITKRWWRWCWCLRHKFIVMILYVLWVRWISFLFEDSSLDHISTLVITLPSYTISVLLFKPKRSCYFSLTIIHLILRTVLLRLPFFGSTIVYVYLIQFLFAKYSCYVKRCWKAL